VRIVGAEEIRRSIGLSAAIAAMRDAVIAQSRGECDTPMPMHLDLSSGGGGEVHVKSSYRKGARRFALKVAGTYASRPYGSIALVSVATGETAVFFDDGGYLTDLRTAAVAAMTARELGRTDRALGILGTGIQARLQARLHAEVLDLAEIHVWGRHPERAATCRREMGVLLPGARVVAADSPAAVAAAVGLIVTATASRSPLLRAGDLRPGTLLLVDSLAQCERLGELQHVASERNRAVELGAFCERRVAFDAAGPTVADFTGLGAEDLFIAEACCEKLETQP
jgi:ornithine cyclodeaminase